MAISSRAELKAYCLRRLGHPVIKINVADDQIEDRIDDALDFFNEFHYDSTARFFHKHLVTATDVANQYITIPDEITHIRRILPLNSEDGSGTTTEAIFDPVYQMHFSDLLSFGYTGSSVAYYTQWKSHMRLVQSEFSGLQQEIDFTRYEHQLKIRVEWGKDITAGQWIIIDAERLLLDPNGGSPSLSDVYNDQFLKEYATALLKEMWGTNLKKFSGIQMVGGVTFNGEQIFQEAKEDIQRIREEARMVWEEPLGIYIG